MQSPLTRMRRAGGRRGCMTPLLILVLLVAGFLLLRGCGRDDTPAAPQADSGGGLLGGVLGGVLGGADPNTAPNTAPDTAPLPDLNRIVSALNVDADGCALDPTDSFYAAEPIYIVVPESLIPRSTELFVRLSNADGPIEDADPIIAESDLRSCAWFVFQPRGRGFDAGTYTAELFVNGRAADRVRFSVVAEEDSFAPGAAGGSSAVDAGLQRVVAGYDLDPDGCAVTTERFAANEDIYLSAGPGFIPAGAQIDGRLLYEGSVLEEASPLRAESDMNTCVYFLFEAGRGFAPGVYEGEIRVDGALAGTATFTVRR